MSGILLLLLKIDLKSCYSLLKPNSRNFVQSRKTNLPKPMEFSAFTVMGKNFDTGQKYYFKEMIFITYENKICVQDSESGYDAVVMSIDDLMKNKYMKMCYELSRVAIGKPNIDPDYYESDDDDYIPNPNNLIDYKYKYIDTLYIVEDVVTNIKEAKKGNTDQTIDYEILENMTVSTDAEIAVFYSRHNLDVEQFEDYTVLVDNL